MMTPVQRQENNVRKLAARRGYQVNKSRHRLYVKETGEFQLLKGGQPVVITMPSDRRPTLDDVEAYLRAQRKR